MAQPQLPSDAAFGRIDDFFERYEGSEGDVDFARINKETLGLIFAFAPPASPARDSPQADDTYLNASLDFGARYMQANTAWVPVDQPMPPWTSAHIFTQAARAASKVHVPSEKAWTFRRPYEAKDIYEDVLYSDDREPSRPWQATTILCDSSDCIRGCIIADWSASPNETPQFASILQSELIAGLALLARLLYRDYWPLAQSFMTDNKLEIRLITFTRSFVRALSVTMSVSTIDETAISFALQDFPPLHIEDATTTNAWQPYLSWAIGHQGESQRHRGDQSPAGEDAQFAIRGNGRRDKPGGGPSSSSSRNISDSVSWSGDNPGSRVPSNEERELARLQEDA